MESALHRSNMRKQYIFSFIIIFMFIFFSFTIFGCKDPFPQTGSSSESVSHVSMDQTLPRKHQYSLMYPTDKAGEWRIDTISIPNTGNQRLDIYDCLKELVRKGKNQNLPYFKKTFELNDVYITRTGLLILDFHFDSDFPTLDGIEAERRIISSFLATIETNFPDIYAAKFLVNGKENETFAGHLDISSEFPLKEGRPKE